MEEIHLGKLAKIDLSNKEIRIETIDKITQRRYLGGSALASYFLLKYLRKGVDPLSKDNVLVFTTSTLTGVPIPGANRYTVAAKSPLTGGFGESEAGGCWAPQLKKAGFDALIITGKSHNPVYLWIHDGMIEIKNAKHLYGKYTWEAENIIKEELRNNKVSVAQIGPGGEKLIRYACIINNLRHANGRTGMGTVMGSKNLRAVVVYGNKNIYIKDKKKVKEISRWFGDNWKEISYNNYYQHGTAAFVGVLNKTGMLPTRNFIYGQFSGAEKISGEIITKKYLKKREGCYACPIKCKRIIEIDNVNSCYGGPEYETIAAFGSLCEIDDYKSIAKANELCNKNAIDTISTGVNIAFAMECFEKGIISIEDTGGIKLTFGNPEAMLKVVKLICQRKGIGDILANGVYRSSKVFGKDAEKYAMHVKGQEIPMHEPRGKTGMALGYALSPTGADHLETPQDPGFSKEGRMLNNVNVLGIIEPIDPLDLSYKKVKLFSYTQKIWSLYNSLGICDFVAAPAGTLTLEKLVDVVKAVTGWRTSLFELLKVGEKANTMARCFNVREGFTCNSDILPDRFFSPIKNGPLKGCYIERQKLILAIKIYYEMQGWDIYGNPTKTKLSELNLEWISV